MARRPALRLGRARVLPPDIERRSADGAVAQRGVNSVLVEDRAASNVDEEGRALHQRETPPIDQPLGLRAERGAQHDGIAFRQHLVERGEGVDALDAIAGRTRAAVGGDDAAAERRRAPRHLASDPAKPDDADRLAEDLAMRRAALHPARPP